MPFGIATAMRFDKATPRFAAAPLAGYHVVNLSDASDALFDAELCGNVPSTTGLADSWALVRSSARPMRSPNDLRRRVLEDAPAWSRRPSSSAATTPASSSSASAPPRASAPCSAGQPPSWGAIASSSRSRPSHDGGQDALRVVDGEVARGQHTRW
jgi:hypothetical protein